MKKTSVRSFVSVLEAYGMYLITGIACTCIGAAIMVLKEHFSVSLEQVAALASAFAFGRVIMVFFCGIITERFGVRTAFRLGFLALSVNLIFMPINTNYWVAMLLMAIAGAGMGFQDSGCPVVLSAQFPGSYSSAMSAGQAFFGAGCFLPPLAMSILLSLGLSWKLMYTIFGALAFVCFVGTFFMPESYQNAQPKQTSKQPHSSVSFKGNVLFMVCLLVGMFFYSAIVNVVHTYTTAYVMHFGAPENVAVNVLTMFSIGAMVGSILFIPILRRFSAHKIMLFNSVATLVFLGSAILMESLTVFFVNFTLAGLFSGVLFSVLITIATEDAGPHKALVASIVGLVGGASDILTPLLTGRIVNASSVTGAFLYSAAAMVITIISAAAMLSLHKRTQHS
ncbi:MFS transporter [Oscillospiraceae bacterium MB08-C2-2]|nr:MFS transporter [Oscillospiraceae bacterium MB08-C2-2]